jgi:DNA-binding NtrC family response regulator
MANYKILVVDDDRALRDTIHSYLSVEGYSVAEAHSGKACREFLELDRPDAIVMDYSLPDTNGLQLLREIHVIDPSLPVIVMTGYATIDLAVHAMKEGAEQFVAKPFESSILLKLLEKVFENRRVIRREQAERSRVVRFRRDPFLGASESIRRLESSARSILGTSLPILIQGETGTGKGVLAEWLTKQGPRSNEAFVDLNCAGLNRELLESDLFGHEKGAFTGAITQKTGLLDVAHRGTLFLDEIGDMDISIQPKLLKVLDEKRFRRVGGVRDRTVDVHLIAATHQDMGALVEDGKFRRDLYFRVSTIPLVIPPLRKRIDDIPIMAEWILNRLREELNRGQLQFGNGVMAALESYSWPGNIRELRNVLERAALLCKDGVICTEDLHFQLTRTVVKVVPVAQQADEDMTLEDLERRHISFVLQKENGKVDRAAAKLGIPRSSLYVKIRQYGITTN